MSHCKACDEPLVLAVDDTSPEVPDDLHLSCGCHFHWECLMDEAPGVALTLKCPSCETFLAANQAGPSSTNRLLQSPAGTPILARYSNEGGVQEQIDILPSLTEEAYLQGNPEARPARALHVMCAEGDVDGIVELLQRKQGEGSDTTLLVRYQDPLSEMRSGLHVAVEKGREEVVWLLLWLSSTMATESFPTTARNAAESMRLRRLNVGSGDDIRQLQDSRGRTAEQVAQERPDSWTAILQAGVLSS